MAWICLYKKIKGKNIVLRGVKKESLDKFKTIWNTRFLQFLCYKGFIPKINISTYYSDKYPLILEAEYLPKTKYRSCWTYYELLCEVYFVSVLQKICRREGFSLLDPHYYNVVLKLNRLYYIDIGSFTNKTTSSDYSMILEGLYDLLLGYYGSDLFFCVG